MLEKRKKNVAGIVFWIILALSVFIAIAFGKQIHNSLFAGNSTSSDQPVIDCSHYGELMSDNDAHWCEQQWERQAMAPSDAPAPPSNCTLHCASGKACGNGCISINEICHLPPGTACDN
jgi:hypothetical protein